MSSSSFTATVPARSLVTYVLSGSGGSTGGSTGVLRGVGSNRCLDVPNNATTNGTLLEIWDCNDGANQQWTLNADGTVVGRGSGLCLDVTGAGTANGTAVRSGPATAAVIRNGPGNSPEANGTNLIL